MVGWPVSLVTAVAILCNSTGMVKYDLAPPFNCMTRAALKTELAVMRFILGVAGDTGWVIALIGGILMTVETFQLIMSTDQEESSGTVIKDRKSPPLRCMAHAALVPHLVLVHIVLLVAGFTFLGSGFEHLDRRRPGMTFSAIQEGVQVFQLKRMAIVIKIAAISFNPIMASQAGIPKHGEMISH